MTGLLPHCWVVREVGTDRPVARFEPGHQAEAELEARRRSRPDHSFEVVPCGGIQK